VRKGMKEGKGEGEGCGRKGRGKVASWLLGDGRTWLLDSASVLYELIIEVT